MKIIYYIINFVAILFLSSNCKYPIKHRFVNIEDTDRYLLPATDTIKVNANNIFILKIKQERSNRIQGQNEDKLLYAEIPFLTFDQITAENEEKDHFIEETYIYLHNIETEKNTGRAIYWATYPLLGNRSENTYDYFNSDKYIYSGIIRSMWIGYWYKNNNELSVYFKRKKRSKEKLIGFKGSFNPSESFVIEKASTVATAPTFKSKKNNLHKIKDLDKGLLFLNIEDVFNLNIRDSSNLVKGLYFRSNKIGRKLVIEPFNKKFKSTEKKQINFVDEIYYGFYEVNGKATENNCVIFQTSNGKRYQFKWGNSSTTKRDEKVFSIFYAM